MRTAWLLALPLGGCLLVEPVSDYEGPRDSGTGKPDASGDSGNWPSCPSGEKTCATTCVSVDAPEWGCTPAGCTPCSLPHAVASCAGDACAVASCASGFGNCDGAAANGCETALGTSQHCAQCGDACPSGASCVAGVCKMTACPAGFADCDGLVANGCEADLHTTGTCGSCQNKCKPSFICSDSQSAAGWVCACPNANACGNGGSCFFGLCECVSGQYCAVGQSCVAPGQCG